MKQIQRLLIAIALVVICPLKHSHAAEKIGLRLGAGVGFAGNDVIDGLSTLLKGNITFESNFNLGVNANLFVGDNPVGGQTSTFLFGVTPGYSFQKDFFVIRLGVPFGITENRFVTGISGELDYVLADHFTVGFDLNSYIVTGSNSYNLSLIAIALGTTF
jgi:hypothetical protein